MLLGQLFLLLICIFGVCQADPAPSVMTTEELHQKALDLFDFAWGSYLKHGFPADEVRPISCAPLGPSRDLDDTAINDSCGNFSSTLIDNLDTLALLGDVPRFAEAVSMVREQFWDSRVLFNRDTTVQVFETDIRILGGLLSGHLFALRLIPDQYDNFLLELAKDLGARLVLAYESPTRFPFPRTNLAKGPAAVPKRAQSLACTSGVSTPVLEMTLLSRLSGDPRFELWSVNAFGMVWNMRSDRDLLAMTLDPYDGKWLDRVSGAGASIDSFYEYALKFAILFDDSRFAGVWDDVYAAVLKHSGDFLAFNLDFESGTVVTPWIDSLSAFLPGLQVLSGDISTAQRFHGLFSKVWNAFGGLPERWNFQSLAPSIDGAVSLEWWPLRPEYIESTYHLYRATKDPLYLQIAANFVERLQELFREDCGFSGMQDVRSGERQDRMESFVIGETLKYLVLLFDDSNEIHSKLSNVVFSTEAHPLWYDASSAIPYTVEQVKEVLQTMLTDNYWFSKRLPYLYLDDHMYNFVQQHLPSYLDKVRPVAEAAQPHRKVQNGLVLEDAYNLDRCDVPKLDDPFTSSRVIDPDFDTPARMYASTLVRPDHLQNISFELDAEQDTVFRETFVNSHIPTCNAYEPDLAQISPDPDKKGALQRIRSGPGGVQAGDYYVTSPSHAEIIVDMQSNLPLRDELAGSSRNLSQCIGINALVETSSELRYWRIWKLLGRKLASDEILWVDPSYEGGFFHFDMAGCAYALPVPEFAVLIENMRMVVETNE
ncbi:unnamed protein product [Kuraishia capsulata CBS 1993]|uniref:alpha-1,2-Mannosidase n=1 Tax=Kuraishia capsulata CBS 1993 TaxID=1382522 RepID=W6MNP0_9ASCO|nr:uncharacterized protein KUCA_T00002651001 [Kuraishia capsulata CBS 1993]CDK26677.1 unnamed protein product [Kuraishia capsulata CBS 1993]